MNMKDVAKPCPACGNSFPSIGEKAIYFDVIDASIKIYFYQCPCGFFDVSKNLNEFVNQHFKDKVDEFINRYL